VFERKKITGVTASLKMVWVEKQSGENFSFYRCTVHLGITKVFHSPTNALFINLRKL
jgi:hypothetical protein